MLTISLLTRYETGSAPMECPFFANAKVENTVLLVDTRRGKPEELEARRIVFCRQCGGRGRVASGIDEVPCELCNETGRATL